MQTDQKRETLHRMYAGWLGKLIGVRLGAPVEMWTSEQILEKYGTQTGYLMDYHEFAADDDTNGPVFFIRALEDSGRYRDMTAADVGRAWLNYPPWGKGMYWWGGYGISAEHTAYENLRSGVQAPASGSRALNGRELSEQIGGQIFSDAWGLMCPGDPTLAADLAERAASVSHDGEAIYGGRFVAACIAAAYAQTDIGAVVEAGLAQIPADSLYTRVFRDVQAFHRAHPDDWQACLAFLRTDYWRDRYGGGCHIIPNAGIMALALCYGQGDFDRTLTLCNWCGFDTDCNVGNLGAIMGTFVGLSGISDSWRAPINDFFVCSSVVGAHNFQDAASFAQHLAQLAERLGTLPPSDGAARLPRLNFALPGSTHGCLLEQNGEVRPAYGHWQAADGGHIRLRAGAGVTRVYQRTYMRHDEFADDRYSPAFSPALYPGQTVTAEVRGQAGMTVRPFAYDSNADQYRYGEAITLPDDGRTVCTWQIPPMDGACLSRAGVEWSASAEGEIALLSLDWQGGADYTLDFARERLETWSYAHKTISQLTQLKGYWRLLDGRLHGSCADLAEAYTGDPAWEDGIVSCQLTPLHGQHHRLLLRVQGGARAYAAELSAEGISLLRNDGQWRTLASAPLAWAVGRPVVLRCEMTGNALRIYADGALCLTHTDAEAPLLHGQVGFGVAEGSHCAFAALSVRPIRKEETT